MSRAILTDGNQIKNIALDELSEDAWTYLNKTEDTSVDKLYRYTPWLFRGVNLISGAVSHIPWRIESSGGVEVTNSIEYVDPTRGAMPDPARLIDLVTKSLLLNGRAYLLKERNRARVLRLRYLAPSTITEQIDPNTGEIKFTRSVNTKQIPYTTDDIIYFWYSDPSVELGPPKAWPARSAMHAATVLTNLDVFVEKYFERGAIRPTILTVAGNPPKAERERMEYWYQKLMGGITNAFKWKVFSADTIDVKVIGDGLDQLRDVELTEIKRQDIAAALGVPYAILFSEAANYATAKEDSLRFYSETVVPLFEYIGDTLSTQFITPQYGYTFVPTPQDMDIYRTDEQEAAAGLPNLVNSGVPLLTAMDLLGFDLTDEQRAEIEAAQSEKKERADMLTERLSKPAEPEPEEEEEAEEEEPQPAPPALPAQSTRGTDLDKWRRKAIKAVKDGKSASVKFESDQISLVLAAAISGALEAVTTPEEVQSVFESAWIGYP